MIPEKDPTCTRCGTQKAQAPSPLWLLAVAGAWLYAFASVFAAILLGPAIILVLPFVVVGGMCLVTEAHRAAFRPAECGRCGAIVPRRREGVKALEQRDAVAPMGPARAA